MELIHLELLAVQRELYAMPRGLERFRAYLTRLTGGTGDLALPLVALNPMGKAHMLAVADAWIACGAEEAAAGALREAALAVAASPGRLRVGLVLGDDVAGGWTNRYTTDFAQRFESAALSDRDFATALLWSSEPASASVARREVLRAVARTCWAREHGPAKALREMLAQEDHAAGFAGLPRRPWPEERWLDATDAPALFACLYGDEAAVSLGYQALGVAAALL